MKNYYSFLENITAEDYTIKASDLFKIGDRIMLSKEGAKTFFLKSPIRQGAIMGFTKDGKCVKIKWDSVKSITAYHYSFIQTINPKQHNQ